MKAEWLWYDLNGVNENIDGATLTTLVHHTGSVFRIGWNHRF